MERITIGELARQTRVSRETVRYYERCRLLPRPSRSVSGYRVFADDAVQRLRFIRQAQELGFSLGEIRELLALRIRAVDTCERVRERAQAKIADIDRRIKALQRMRLVLARLVNACAGRRKTDECPILDSLEAAHDPI
jgi:Hg(II)-responsive transcriptional regulator